MFYSTATEAVDASFRASTLNLEARLRKHHPELEIGRVAAPVIALQPDQVVAPKPLPPIKDQLLAVANDIVSDTGPAMPAQPTVAEIQRLVCDYFGLTKVEILSCRRTHDIVRPRQIAMYLCRKLTTRSLPDIGKRFGGMDHTTILNAVAKVGKLIESDPKIRTSVDELLAELAC